jgi:diguanylate cyclase (GGDEF)-like protein
VAHWGEQPPQSTLIQHAECQAVQQGQSLLLCKDSEGAPCDHAQDASDCSLLCVPLTDQNGVLGLLHLRSRLLENDEACLHWQQVAEMFGGQIAMALTNLSLLERLQHQVLHDALTGLFNRRYLDETLKRELQQAARSEQSLGIIMLDIDHFKHFNDTYGHDAGDVLLRAVGAFLQASTRYGDIACRYGGEEFTLVMPGASLEDTHQRADQLCEGVRQITVQYGAQSLPTITISLGVAAFPHHGTTDEEVMKAADNALYQAKTAGRNQVIVAPLLRQDERGH